MNATPPDFSVVIPTHDGGTTVLDALDSVLSQTFRSLEVIVVDDGSTDDTQARLEMVSDPRLTILRQRQGGVSAARNAGAAVAKGRFLVFLDSDDVASTTWLERLHGVLDDGRVSIACAGARVVGRGSGDLLRIELPADGGVLFQRREVLFLAGTFAVERLLFAEVGGYRETLAYSENTDLGIRLVQRCVERGLELGALACPLIEYRIAEQPKGCGWRSCAGFARHRARLEAAQYFLQHHGHLLRRNRELHRIHLSLAGVNAARCGSGDLARTYLWSAIRRDPWRLKSYLHLAYLVHPTLAGTLPRLLSPLLRRSAPRPVGVGEGSDSVD